jgi:hypothetical protein
MDPKDADFYCFYFKTVWCPFVYEHEKDKCVYAHNWYDFRRRTQFINYSEQTCLHWTNKLTIVNYQDGCPNGHHCNMSHGRKEALFHVNYYRMKLCHLQDKCIKVHCPFAHSPIELRFNHPQQNLIFLPRNRKNSFGQINTNQLQYKQHFIENEDLIEISSLFAYAQRKEDPKYQAFKMYNNMGNLNF